MTLDRRLETYREIYDAANDSTRNDIDDAIEDLRKNLFLMGYAAAMDDRLENLVTAVVKYLVESGNAL